MNLKKDAEAPPAVILSGRKTTMVEEQRDGHTGHRRTVQSGLSGQDLPNMRVIAALDGGYNKRPKRTTGREFPLNTHVNAVAAPCS